LTSEETCKIILKVHQILVDCLENYELLVSNNTYEAHALYHVLEKLDNSECLDSNPLDFKVVVCNETKADGNNILISKDLLKLGVSARGSFNPYINAVVGGLLQEIGQVTKPMPDRENLARTAHRLLEESKNHTLDESSYQSYLNTFVWGTPESISDSLNDLTRDLWYCVLKNDKSSLDYIEKLLVGLLGHNIPLVRDLAVKHLNVFYDDTHWQLVTPFEPVIKTTKDEFLVMELVDNQADQLVLELHAPGFFPESSNYVLSYHEPEMRNTPSGVLLKVNLGKFPRCGFYDWRFIKYKNGTLEHLVKHSKSSDVETVPVQGRFIVHPSEVRDLQVHEIFIDFQDAKFDVKTGAIQERGNFQTVKESLKERASSGINCLYLMGALERDNGKNYENKDASPLALVCRRTACSMLGGGKEFKSLLKEADETGVRIIVDCVARISSKHYHRRYKNKLLYTRNQDDLPVVCYGTDGRSIKYEDSAMLNYRLSEVWKILVQDVIEFVKQYQVGGIHIDNAQAWPQIMELDKDEMYYLDSDGQPHYTTQEIFDGQVVQRNENFAYWASSLREKWANPIFVKLCKEIWRLFPEFLIMADIWHGTGLEERDKCIARSGPIPRLYDLPIKLSSIFGKRLHKSGKFNATENKDVGVLKDWYERTQKRLPEGSITVQSSTGHFLPYPALLYGKGAWAAIDVLFMLPSIPMTFIGEQDGHAYRAPISSLYEFEQGTSLPRQLSGANLIEAEKVESSVPRVESAASLSLIPDLNELIAQEQKFKEEVGYDMSKIKHHYKHRRQLRHEKDVLRYGGLVPLVLRHDHGWHKQVLAFARYLPEEVAVITINLNEHPVKGYLDLRNLEKVLSEDNIVYSMGEWFDPESDDFYFREELLNEFHEINLLPFRTDIKGIYPSDKQSDFVFERSLARLNKKLQEGKDTYGNYIVIKLLECLKKDDFWLHFNEIANSMGIAHQEFLAPMEVTAHQLIKSVSSLSDILAGRLLGICDYLSSVKQIVPPVQFARELRDSNKIGPIVFTCPELGRFSTVGGLGVMVDELSQGLVNLGEEIWVISPYYDKNKKGVTGYLENDAANVRHIANIEIQIGDEKYILGMHKGSEKGVHLVFLHNAYLFPQVYADGTQSWRMAQLVAWGKGTLEALCFLRLIPSFLVTNDWFTGLVPAYAKTSFGGVFNGTTLLHVVHNLDPSYEGRLYPQKPGDFFQEIHGLDCDFFVDSYWSKTIVNPSRCALLCSDQWGTVSPSYRNELLALSPLKELLKQKDKPFAFPNGIPVKERMKRLEGKGTHLDAKKALQKTYFSMDQFDNNLCLMGFVGRITEQKGVHLIIEAAEQLIPQSNFKVQFLVGGPINPGEKYSENCANRMRALRHKYPHHFFADPDNFFYEGPLVNLGCDYGLMPSKFEPGGIVQHEFFVAGTPVIAYKTGGLKDTVHEFNPSTREGSGFLFENYNVRELIDAINRAMNLFLKGDYSTLRKNSFKATMDGAVVSRAWNKEIYRLKNKIYFENTERKETFEKVSNLKWRYLDYDDSLPENKSKKPKIKRTPSGALLAQAEENLKQLEEAKSYSVIAFRYPGKINSVHLTGSFDNWEVRHPMAYDHVKHQWQVTLQLPKGKHFYKFVVDNKNWMTSEEYPTEKDPAGNTNNFIEVN